MLESGSHYSAIHSSPLNLPSTCFTCVVLRMLAIRGCGVEVGVGTLRYMMGGVMGGGMNVGGV